jgi:hypothetical protein
LRRQPLRLQFGHAGSASAPGDIRTPRRLRRDAC